MKNIVAYVQHYLYSRRYVLLVIFLLTVCRFIVLQLIYKQYPLSTHLILSVVSFFSMIAIWEDLAFFNQFLDKKMPFEGGVVRRIIIQSLLGFTSVFIITMPSLYLADWLGVEIEGWEKTVGIIQAIILVTAISLGYFGYHFLLQWKRKLLEAERLQNEKLQIEKEFAQMQYINLQNHLNPHFLFNSITSVNSLVYENQELASDFLKQLAKVYRYVLQHKNKDLVSLRTELNFIQNYLFLLKTRFQDAFCCLINVSKEALAKQIVPVTLQVLVENAIKHNIMTPEQTLYIHIYDEKGYLWIQNNLQKKNIVEYSNRIGLENLKALYGYLSDCPLMINETKERFTIQLPLID